jgi:hypothetical protein
MVAATKNHKNYSLKCRRNQELTGLPSKMSEYHGADIANASLPASVHGTFHVQVPDLWTINRLLTELLPPKEELGHVPV